MKWLTVFSTDSSNPPVYTKWLNAGGITPVPLSAGSAIPDPSSSDALFLTGGVDVNPDRYEAAREPEVTEIDDKRDELELRLARLFIQERKPVFGICRGIQLLNVAMGGKLIQHIPKWMTSRGITGEQHGNVDGKDSEHPVTLLDTCRMGRALQGVKTVNSWHHQAADPEAIGKNLVVTALSPGGVVEAIEGVGPHAGISVVQWHPERLPWEHPASASLLEMWKRICASRRTGQNPTRCPCEMC